MIRLEQIAAGSPYAGYAYSYPHKTAYRRFASPVPLHPLWASQRRDALFLYLHVPFCEMRCGFCNLFTTASPARSVMESYAGALDRQAERTQSQLGDFRFARMAIGGGTPTDLPAKQIEALFDVAAHRFGIEPGSIPCSVETSPRTADAGKMRVLRERGVSRISMGVQSMIEQEVKGAGRAQKNAWVASAVQEIRNAGFPTLNLDLIYGLEGQTIASWLESLRAVLSFEPEELYLYPLYVRELTGLGRSRVAWEDLRLECYRAGRDLLLSRGYRQLSMRMFRSDHAPEVEGPVYCCQDDGMVGVGCGARSYAQSLHYSSEFAVGRGGIGEIIADYVARPSERFDHADYGAAVNEEDQRRRRPIKSLLRCEGLLLSEYVQRFGADLTDEFPRVPRLVDLRLAEQDGDLLTLTPAGLERSDTIGPWLYSDVTRQAMQAFELR